MALDLHQAAKMLRVSPATVRRWARQGRLGMMKPSGEFLFEEAELGRWAHNQGLSLGTAKVFSVAQNRHLEKEPLCAAVQRGAILHGVPGISAGEVLSNLVELAPLSESCNRLGLLTQLQAREALASTALGAGVALPHPRSPSVEFIHKPMVVVAMLASAADWSALDQKPVHSAILLLSPTPQQHLQVLSRISFLLREPSFINALRGQVLAPTLQQLMADLEIGFGR